MVIIGDETVTANHSADPTVCTTVPQPLHVYLPPEETHSDSNERSERPSPLVCTTSPDDSGIMLNPKDLSLQGNLAGVPTKLLVDTGASITVLNAALYRNLPSFHTMRTSATAGLIEPSPQLANKYSVQGAAALVTAAPDGNVPFRILNPTTKPVTIHKGTTLGAFTCMNAIAAVHDNYEQLPPSLEPFSSDDLKSYIDLSNTTLTEEQKEALLALLQRYRDVFALSPDELGRTDLIKYTIDTGDSLPI